MNFFKYLIVSLLASGAVGPNSSAECLKNLDPLFNQGRDYFHRGQYLLATQQFSFYAQLSCGAEQRDRGHLRWAQSLFELGETLEGNFVLDKINSQSPQASAAKVVRAWYQPSLVSSLPQAERARFESWSQQIGALPNPKSALLSGTMSAVVPGLGQVYNGNYQSGFFSFVLNALFLSATFELYNKNMDATAIASTAVFSVFYVGNIVGTVQSTKSYNRASQEGERARLKQEMFPELTF